MLAEQGGTLARSYSQAPGLSASVHFLRKGCPMLVYGDVESLGKVSDKQAALASFLTKIGEMPAGIDRHATLVSAFISASELVQGLIDAEFHKRGFDTCSAAHANGMELLLDLAHCVERSWRSGFSQGVPSASALERLFGFDADLTIRTKRAEGYEYYALYPESYLEAAACSGLGPNTRVIGIRSIGTGLSALVAAALGAPRPFTLRPVGHPFDREVKVDSSVTAELTADRQAAFAIVDEGPGLSGSSFGAVADWLEASGVPRNRIHFFPSHGGEPGPQAGQTRRERWREAARHVVPMEHLLLSSTNHLSRWIEELIGPLESPLADISGGIWRTRHGLNEGQWPAANIQQERRKFLVRASGTEWLVKFVGLGETGLRKFQRAKMLSQAGFTPDVIGYRHGFLVERWYGDAKPLAPAFADRERLVERAGSYLGFRARRLQTGEHRGASLGELAHMACYNVRHALGDRVAHALERALSKAGELEDKVRRVDTDNRMHAWEWLVSQERILKADALDHSEAHDLIGHQDIGWDIVGATVELGLNAEEAFRLCIVVEQESGYPVHPEILSFMRPCYLAFQMGAHIMAAQALGESRESDRLRRAADRYAILLHN